MVDAYEQLFKIDTYSIREYWKKIGAYVTQVGWSVSMRMWRCRFLQSSPFSLCALLSRARPQCEWKKGANARTTETIRSRERKKCKPASKQATNQPAIENGARIPAATAAYDHFFVFERFWSAKYHDTPCLTLGCFMIYLFVWSASRPFLHYDRLQTN